MKHILLRCCRLESRGGRDKINRHGSSEKWPLDAIARLCLGGIKEYSSGWGVIYGGPGGLCLLQSGLISSVSREKCVPHIKNPEAYSLIMEMKLLV